MSILRILISLKFFAIACLLLLGLLMAFNLFDPTLEEDTIADKFANGPYKPHHHYMDLDSGKIHYITMGDSTLDPILLIHGSPGSWDNYVQFISETSVTENYFIIALDRPGFGQSGMSSARSLQHQSQCLQPIIEKYITKDNGTAVGHSYGGALVVQLGVDYPDRFKALVSAAGTIADTFQEPRWYNYLVKYPPAKWIMNHDLLLSNREMWNLPDDLRELYKQLPQLDSRVAIIQGNRDILVNPFTAQYFKNKLSGTPSRIFTRDKMNHFVIWSDTDLIIEALEWSDGDEQ